MLNDISSAQCRAARALLGWTQQQLSDASGVQVRVIARFETTATTPHATTFRALIDAFEKAGIVFVSVHAATGGVILIERERPDEAPLPRAVD